MYQSFIKLSEDSYIEITSRLYNQQEVVVLALRGTKDNETPAIASVMVDETELDNLIYSLQAAKQRVQS